ncbi:MAG: hypothetical protein WCK47_11600 [bacterium]|nr:hypothetical protein [Candidatus Sumerlaeota bacterium]
MTAERATSASHYHQLIISALLALLLSIPSAETRAVTTNTITPPPRRDVPGRRIAITSGTIYVPSYFNSELTTGADTGNLHIFGYTGMTNQDHFNHFYAIGDLFKLTSLRPAASEEQ